MKILIPVVLSYLLVAVILNLFSKKRNKYEANNIEDNQKEEEIKDNITEQNLSETVQVAMAETKDFETQKYLLKSPDLSSEALVTVSYTHLRAHETGT